MSETILNISKRWAVFYACTILSAIIGLILFIASCNHLENYEYGYTFDRFSGKIEKVDHAGWVVKPVWRYGVHRIDLRPCQVSISANARILNAKLVKFNPEGLDEFVQWHGRNAGEKPTDLHEILKSYAFNVNSGSDCPFLIIVDEMQQKPNLPTHPTK